MEIQKLLKENLTCLGSKNRPQGPAEPLAVVSLSLSRSPSLSGLVSLAENGVYHPADEGQGKTQPGQNVGGPIPPSLVFAVEVNGVDSGCDHHTQTGEELEDPREDETVAYLQGEELAHEDEEPTAAEDDSEDHARLHSLQAVIQILIDYRGTGVVPRETLFPNVHTVGVCAPPNTVSRGYNEEDDCAKVEEEDGKQ